MISVEEALSLIEEKTAPFQESEVISVNNSLGRILSKPVYATMDLPPFRQSIMDGYAVSIHISNTYKLVGEIKAGDASNVNLLVGEAVRIFTGARVPDAANAVIMQEKVTVSGNNITLGITPKEDDHIREKGAQIQQGDLCLSKGFQLNPSAIALIKSFGITQIEVTKTPKVSILVTGNELVAPETSLTKGKVYESNSGLISTALQQKEINAFKVSKVRDSLEDTEKALKELLSYSDVILISGGISVGDYDFVGKALSNLGVKQHFYTVKQKPGKPLYFGSKNETYVLGLPGNPASTLTCLYIYGFPLLDILSGNTTRGLKKIEMPIAETIENRFGRALFLKARVDGREVTQLNLQNSAMVLSFAQANALIYVPENSTKISKGEHAQVILLP